MTESKNNSDNYRTVIITIGTIKKDPEILRVVPDHLNTKNICKHGVKKLLFVTNM